MEYLLGPLAQYGPIGSQKSCVNSITEFSIFFLFFFLNAAKFFTFFSLQDELLFRITVAEGVFFCFCNYSNQARQCLQR